MNRFSAVVSLTLLALLVQGCTRDPNVRKLKYLNSGKAYAAQGKEKEAVIQFSNAIKIDPHYAAAHFELAKAYLKLGVPMGAYTELMRTVAADPKNVQARLDLGQMLLAGRQYPRALDQANAILAIDPKNGDAYGLKSAIAMANNDRPEALKDIQQALAIDPNRAGFHAQLGLIQGANPAQSKEAEEQVRDAVKLDPKNAPRPPALVSACCSAREIRLALLPRPRPPLRPTRTTSVPGARSPHWTSRPVTRPKPSRR